MANSLDPDQALEDKKAYFAEHSTLFSLSPSRSSGTEDEKDFPDDGMNRADQLFVSTSPSTKSQKKPMAPPEPPTLVRQRSSFLGPTPKERKAEFERFAKSKRETTRGDEKESSRAENFPVVSDMEREERQGKEKVPRAILKHATSLPEMDVEVRNREGGREKVSKGKGKEAQLEKEEEIPFYKRMGTVPRELRGGKNVKLAENIRVEPVGRQLFRRKVIYFYPNDDISAARRQRIHKLIQLGGAWVTRWRDDVTHVMVDDKDYVYSSLLKHLNMMGLPRKVVLVKFDPYVPQCIQFNTVLDPTANRFLVKGAPKPTSYSSAADQIESSAESSQVSLQVKPTKKELAARNTQKTDSVSTEDSYALRFPTTEVQSSPLEDIVKDSFIQAPSDPVEEVEPPDAFNDELSEAIKQTKAIAHLPLDDEDSDDFTPQASADQESDPGTDVESPEKIPKRKGLRSTVPKANGPSKGFNQRGFQCMDPRKTNESASQNPNARTIQVLEEMGRYYDQMQDSWRTLAYRRGVATLRKQTTKVTTKEQAEALPFIGSRLASKIEEIVLTDRLRRLDSTKSDPTDQVLRLFLGIYGVGLSQAQKWIQAGHRTLSDLLANAHLTPNQKLGIQHHTDFATRIPRTEVQAHGTFVRNELHKIDPSIQVHIMGSYRRGAKDSGDIDLIITAPDVPLSTLQTIVFTQLIPSLYALHFLKASLASSSSSTTSSGTKWLGASCLPQSKIWRRLDLLLVPDTELGAALIYFTGNDIFNRSMRLLASKKGMRLNQRGLYKDVMRGKDRVKISEGTLVEGRSERRIFEVLGVPWRAAGERVC